MSAERSENGRIKGHSDFKARLRRLLRSRRNGMFGVTEIIAVSSSAVILLAAVLSYVYFLAPARSSLEGLQLERTRLQNQVRTSEQTVLKGLSTQNIVDKITTSLDDFEGRTLLERNQGRMELYDELNQLIRKNGLRNTSGPSYTPLDTVGSKASSTGSKSANSKWQSVYPGISVSLTVEGSYQKLRRFIRNIETSKQFIIINGIELERATETNAPLSVEGAPGAGSRGSLVSLRMDLATYFQRANDESSADVQ